MDALQARGTSDVILQGGGSWLDAEELLRDRLQKGRVDVTGTTECREAKPQEEDSLEQPVRRNPEDDDARPELDNGEGSINNPVRQKLRVVILARRLECDQRVVARNNHRRSVGEQLTNATNIQVDQR